MSRGYPRFLFSNPSDTKDAGPFIIHTLEPQFIVKPKFDDKRNITECKLLEVWSKEYDQMQMLRIKNEIPQWFRRSGIEQSTHQDDILLTALHRLDFLKQRPEHFTVEQAQILVRLFFKTKNKGFYEGSSSYGIKHFFERVSRFVMEDKLHASWKYCSNDTVKDAFEAEGFRHIQQGPNRYFNISAREIHKAYKLIWIN